MTVLNSTIELTTAIKVVDNVLASDDLRLAAKEAKMRKDAQLLQTKERDPAWQAQNRSPHTKTVMFCLIQPVSSDQLGFDFAAIHGAGSLGSYPVEVEES